MEGNEGFSPGGMQGGVGAGTATMSGHGPNAMHSSSPETHVEINSPKENSMFKDIGKFNNDKPMIDISKPAFENKSISHEEKPKTDVSPNPIIDILHGKEEKPFFNRPESFNEKPEMIDISKPFVETPKGEKTVTEHKPVELRAHTPFYFSSGFKTEEKPAVEEKVNEEPKAEIENEEITEIKPKEQPESKVETVFQNSTKVEEETDVKHATETAFENPTQVEEEVETEPEVRIEFYPAQKDELKPETQPEVKTQTKTEATPEFKLSEKTEPQPQVEIKKGHASSTETATKIQHQDLQEMIGVKSETHSSVATKLQEKMEDAEQYILPELQKQEKLPVTKVREALALEISRQQPDEVVLPKELQEKVRLGKNDKTIEAKAKELFKKRQLEKKGYMEAEPNEEEGILYLKKDSDTNNFREMVTIMQAEKEIQEKGVVTGHELAHVIKSGSDSATSEIVRGIRRDGSLDEVAEQASMLGMFTDINEVKRAISGIVNKITAVKLSRGGEENASEDDAEVVYQQQLHGVEANLKEENDEGAIVRDIDGRLIYIGGNQRQVGRPMEDEVYNS